MASCTPLELPKAVFAGLARLRDLSRLILVAVQRDDLDAVERLTREGDELLVRLKPLLAGPAEATFEIRRSVDEIVRANQEIVNALSARRNQVSCELTTIRDTKARLRALRLRRGAGESSFDRDA